METISQFGSDALRLGVVTSRSAGKNQAFSVDKVMAGRNFCNKLWNIARYVEDKLGDGFKYTEIEPISLVDHWIVRELNKAIFDIDKKLSHYRFAEASDIVYHTVWDNVADWYIEASKTNINPSMLAWVLDTCLKLAHPFVPFVTETIWQTMTWHNNLLITEKWPNKLGFNDISAGEFSRLKKLVVESRYVTASLPGNKKYDMLYQNDSLIADNADLIKKLAKLKSVQLVDQARGLRLAASGREAWLDISADTLYEHQTNLEVRLSEVRSLIAKLEARLSNESYVKKAPAELVEETKAQLEQEKQHAERLVHELEIIK